MAGYGLRTVLWPSLCLFVLINGVVYLAHWKGLTNVAAVAPTDSESRTVPQLLQNGVDQWNVPCNLNTEDFQEWVRVVVKYLRVPLDPAYGGHSLPLLAAVHATQGSILELGSGFHSTAMLNRLAEVRNRRVMTVDAVPKWLMKFLPLQSAYHEFGYVSPREVTFQDNPGVIGGLKPRHFERWSDVGANASRDGDWDVVFVDQSPAEARAVSILQLRNRTQVFVLHDIDFNAPDQFNFKHRYHFNSLSHLPNSRWVYYLKGVPISNTDVLSDTNGELVHRIQQLLQCAVTMPYLTG